MTSAALAEPRTDVVIEVEGLTKSFGGRAVVRDLTMTGPQGADLRLPRAERQRQDHDDPHALRPAHAGRRPRHLPWLRHPHPVRRDQAPCRLHDAALLALRGSLNPREPRVRRPHLWSRPSPRGCWEAIDRLGLGNRADQLAGESLSGGWKQRLALGACILPEPQLLLLDEPTAGVDPKARRDFWDEIHALAHGGMTVLVSTHYMDEAERCHEIAYIAYGELLAQGSVDEVVAERASRHLDGHRTRPRRSRATPQGRAGRRHGGAVRLGAARQRPRRGPARRCDEVDCGRPARRAGGPASRRWRTSSST